MMARTDAASERTYPSAEASSVLHLREICIQAVVRWMGRCLCVDERCLAERGSASTCLPSGLSIPALVNMAPRLGVRISLIPHTSEASESPAWMLRDAMWEATSEEEQAVQKGGKGSGVST